MTKAEGQVVVTVRQIEASTYFRAESTGEVEHRQIALIPVGMVDLHARPLPPQPSF